MDGLQAAILSVKLKYIKHWTDERIKNANYYDKVLNGIEQVVIPKKRNETKHTYHLYVIRCEKRNELKDFLQLNGIETAIHYPTALPNLPAYEYLGYDMFSFPISSKYQNQILSLPMYPELTLEEIDFIATLIREFYNK